MDKELFDFVAAKAEEIGAAPSASEATKKAVKDFQDAIAAGADQDEAAKKFVDAINGHHTTIDGVIGFMQTDVAKQIYGEEGAAQQLAHEKERKAKGAVWCDCAACRPTHELLTKLGVEKPDVYI